MNIFKYLTINGEQVFYPKYAAFIFLTSVIFLIVGVSIAKKLDESFPSFDKDNEEDVERPKMILLAESATQIGLIGVTTYIFREVIQKGLKLIFDKNLHGNPSKYAILIVAPTMFSQQKSLINKIKFIWE
jgi:hypothetical protein